MRRHLGRATALGVAARRRKTGNTTLLRTLQDLGVATNLELCLDAGDYASYPGSGYQLLDTSGNDYDFNFGADGGPDTDNPTFNGTAGALTRNEYLSFDGGDFLTGASANPTWIENLHKDGAAFTFVMWKYATSASGWSFGTGANTTSKVGVALAVSEASGGSITLNVSNGSGSGYAAQLGTTSPTTAALNQWVMWAVSFDEAAGIRLWRVNGEAGGDGSITYSSPSAAAATHTMQIGTRGDSLAPLPAGSRMAQFMGWSRALSAAELSDIYTKTRTRFGV